MDRQQILQVDKICCRNLEFEYEGAWEEARAAEAKERTEGLEYGYKNIYRCIDVNYIATKYHRNRA